MSFPNKQKVDAIEFVDMIMRYLVLHDDPEETVAHLIKAYLSHTGSEESIEGIDAAEEFMYQCFEEAFVHTLGTDHESYSPEQAQNCAEGSWLGWPAGMPEDLPAYPEGLLRIVGGSLGIKCGKDTRDWYKYNQHTRERN